MYTTNSYADFVMQKSFQDRNIQPDTVQCQFIENFSWKVQFFGKIDQAFDANWHLSEYAAWQTQFFGGTCTFQGKCS